MKLLLVLLAVISLVQAVPEKCTDKLIAVNNLWYQNLTNIAANQFCTYTFKIPKDSFAVLDFEVQNAYDDTVVTITDDFGNSIERWEKTSTYSQNVAIPITFAIHMKTGQQSNTMVQIKITVKKAQPLNSVAGIISTDVNGPSSVIYFDEWKEGTSYILSRRISFLNFLSQKNFGSKSNKLWLFMAKQIQENGAVLVTDNSNLENLFGHEVVFLPTYNSVNVTSSLIIGNSNQGGAITLIGARDGSNPVTVTELYFLLMDPTITGQKFSVSPGGPLADHSTAIPLVHSSLPFRLTSNLNTFYINKGMGSVAYFVH